MFVVFLAYVTRYAVAYVSWSMTYRDRSVTDRSVCYRPIGRSNNNIINYYYIVENGLAQPSTLGYLVLYLAVLTYLPYLACPLVTVTLSPVLLFQSSLVQRRFSSKLSLHITNAYNKYKYKHNSNPVAKVEHGQGPYLGPVPS